MSASRDLVVLGAGPAGLAAAWWAARRGLSVTVLEQAPFVGGAAASHDIGGMRVDTGSHRLHPSTDPAILGDLRALLGEDLQRRTRNGRIRLAGRWLAFPLRAADLVRSLPPGFAAGAAWDAATGWARHPRRDDFAEVVRAGLGPTMLRRFYGPYARKIWGLPPEELSGEQARRRIGANSAGGVLKRVLAAGRGEERPWFFYPRRGFGQIAEALADAAATAGAELRLSSPVTGLTLGDDDVVVGTDGGELRAGRVWSTVPLPLLARLADAPAEVQAAGSRLRFRSMVLVYLVLDSDRYTAFDAHYLPGPETPVTRLSEPRNYRDSADDPPGRTVLCAELPCQHGDEHWGATDEALGELVRDGLEAVGLPRPEPVEVRVRRLSHAYPIYDHASAEAFATLDAWATSLQPRVLTFGRQGLFAHDNTHHALAMAKAAVQALNAPYSWTSAREAFARHVVED
ncbi:MAG TPA: FAD-dependent oxidoreductase [Egibacteraceae bacterium]|nr:FAD-dependent oxidoreductase [Egibacteraceae bacterium]